MELFQHPLSPYAQKIRIALREKGLPFHLRSLSDVAARGGLGELNPRMELPALVDGALVIFDSTVILEYIEDRRPSPALRPAEPGARARARMIEEVCDTHFEAVTWALGELKFFRRADGLLAARLQERAEHDIQRLYMWLEQHLHGDWLNGAEFGWADMAAAPFVGMADLFGLRPAPDRPLGAWFDRVSARPSVAITIAEARETLPRMADAWQRIADGRMKRQFRDHRLEWLVRSGGVEILEKGLEAGNVRFTETLPFDTASSTARGL